VCIVFQFGSSGRGLPLALSSDELHSKSLAPAKVQRFQFIELDRHLMISAKFEPPKRAKITTERQSLTEA